ncbi:hypothetical protein GTW20_21860 [Nocardiopsis alba]|uniref:Uncharacterized protein n=1 Tax=Nocardiopsis alba TaxID=53437 RepID=A0A7K2IXW2_9ACTN|nr:hypothetical protein [Nocardiopsis alba]MYR34828.1 hypothetical protein [Nocardiopsis alba]
MWGWVVCASDVPDVLLCDSCLNALTGVLAAAPYRYLVPPGAVASARAMLRGTRAAHLALVPLLGVRRLTERCPQCQTKDLTRITERGPVMCDYCGLSVQEADQ